MVRAAAATSASAATVRGISKQNYRTKRQGKPRFHCVTLICPILNISVTQWKQLLNLEKISDIFGCIQVLPTLSFNFLLRVFEKHRALTNFESPYRRGPELKEGFSPVKIVGILPLAL